MLHFRAQYTKHSLSSNLAFSHCLDCIRSGFDSSCAAEPLRDCPFVSPVTGSCRHPPALSPACGTVDCSLFLERLISFPSSTQLVP